MKTALTIILLILTLHGYSQQRIAFDLTFKSLGINSTVIYQNVFYKNVFFSAGLTIGNYGKSFMSSYTAGVPYGSLESPYPALTNTIGNSRLKGYSSKSTGAGIVLGIGAFKEFSVKHGVKFSLNNKLFIISQDNLFHVGEGLDEIGILTKSTFYVASISPEISHTIWLNGRTTFNYGIKVPYFYSLDKGKYHPLYRKDVFYGFEPELSIGFTYAVGKCG